MKEKYFLSKTMNDEPQGNCVTGVKLHSESPVYTFGNLAVHADRAELVGVLSLTDLLHQINVQPRDYGVLPQDNYIEGDDGRLYAVGVEEEVYDFGCEFEKEEDVPPWIEKTAKCPICGGLIERGTSIVELCGYPIHYECADKEIVFNLEQLLDVCNIYPHMFGSRRNEGGAWAVFDFNFKKGDN